MATGSMACRWPSQAIALAAFPENVRTDAMADQEDTSPAMATAESGQVLLDLIVDGVSEYTVGMIEGRRVAGIPPYLP